MIFDSVLAYGEENYSANSEEQVKIFVIFAPI